jgi:hypothetical protein
MAKLALADEAKALSVRECVLLLCVASDKEWAKAGITGPTVTAVVVKGLIDKDATGALTLTDRGRTVVRAMLPEL